MGRVGGKHAHDYLIRGRWLHRLVRCLGARRNSFKMPNLITGMRQIKPITEKRKICPGTTSYSRGLTSIFSLGCASGGIVRFSSQVPASLWSSEDKPCP